MSTRPLGPPPVLADDPGPWGVVSSVFAQAGRPGRRRPQPPMGLMLSPPPDLRLPLAGIDDASPVAGIGRLRIVAAAREPALTLAFDEDAGLLRGVSPHVRRAWSVPELTVAEEERPGDDPAADLPAPAPFETVADGDAELAPLATSPDGTAVAVHLREGRADVLAIVRVEDRGIVRWIRHARAAAWSADGRRLTIGGPWGVLLAESTAG
jgi:hypothetical protein